MYVLHSLSILFSIPSGLALELPGLCPLRLRLVLVFDYGKMDF